MSKFRVALFGKFSLYSGDKQLSLLESRKAQELFSYILIHRNRPHSRESLVDLLWGDEPPAHPKKYLRQVLWQIQSAIDLHLGPAIDRVIAANTDWISFNPESCLWLDVDLFESAYESVQGVPGPQLGDQKAQSLLEATNLYKGDLLEGWYQDWCLYERERYRNMYLAMLDKLMGYSEATGNYEAGLDLGQRILRCDKARERTHWRLMRLHQLSGDRSAALRQFGVCVEFLQKELGVTPSKKTLDLRDQILADTLDMSFSSMGEASPALPPTNSEFSDAISELTNLQNLLASAQEGLRRVILMVELSVNTKSELL